MTALGITLDFEKQEVTLDDLSFPMKRETKRKRSLHVMFQQTAEPQVTQEMTSRATQILDSKYDKADLEQIAKDQSHLSSQDRDQLYQLLKKYEDLFDGTLGEWKTEPVSFNMKEGAKPHSQRHYTSPRIHRETFRKELKRLCAIDVLK